MPTARDRLIRILSRMQASGERSIFLVENRAVSQAAPPRPEEEAARTVRAPSRSRARPLRGAGPRSAAGSTSTASRVAAPAAGDDPLEARWRELESEVRACTRCRLCEGRTQAVVGSGTRHTRLFVVGEGPGAQEDLRGEAFVGAAGELLTKILAAVGFARDGVYVTNVVRCRPPGNRIPLPDEVQACAPYLDEQLDIVRPAAILSLGGTAARRLLATSIPIGRLRGRVHLYREIPVVATYHPAALLRSPEYKRPTWEDVQLLRRVYDERVAALDAGEATA